VTEALGERETGAIAAGFRQRLPAGCENDQTAADWARRGVEQETAVRWLDAQCAAAGHQTNIGRVGGAKKSVQHVARAPAVGKQLAVSFLVERNVELAEEVGGALGGKRTEDASDDRGASAPEIALGHDAVGDVAASSTADEDFGAGLGGAVDEKDRSGRIRAPGKDRRGQSRGAGADDDDLDLRQECTPGASWPVRSTYSAYEPG
jgi:hypothetical protein